MANGDTRVMKIHLAAVLCVVLLITSNVMPAAAAGCDIFQLVPCMAASKNDKVMPSKQSCANVVKMGQGAAGAKCLCSLLSNSLAKSQGVVPRIALGIPQKCRIAVPKASSAKESASQEAKSKLKKVQAASGTGPFSSLLRISE